MVGTFTEQMLLTGTLGICASNMKMYIC